MLCTNILCMKVGNLTVFLKIVGGNLKNNWTNTRLVCTHWIAFCMLNPNMVMKIWNMNFFWKKLEQFDWLFALDVRVERVKFCHLDDVCKDGWRTEKNGDGRKEIKRYMEYPASSYLVVQQKMYIYVYAFFTQISWIILFGKPVSKSNLLTNTILFHESSKKFINISLTYAFKSLSNSTHCRLATLCNRLMSLLATHHWHTI